MTYDNKKRLDDLTRFYKATKTSEYKIAFLMHLSDEDRREVLKRLHVRTAEELIESAR